MDWKTLKKLPIAEIKKFQLLKLKKFLSEQVYPFSPFYRKVFDQFNINPAKFTSLDDLKRIPFTSKDDLLLLPNKTSSFKDFILQPTKETIKQYASLPKKLSLLATKFFYGQKYLEDQIKREYKPVMFTATTGRSSDPVMFLYSNYDIDNLANSGARLFDVLRINETSRVMNLFPFAPHLAFWQTYYGGISTNTFSTATGGGKVMGTVGNLRLIDKIKPEVLIGVPSYLYHLLRIAASEKKDLSFVNQIILGAEKVPQGLKDKMLELLMEMGAKKVRILGTYGFTEAKRAWGEYSNSSGYMTYPDLEIVECIDPETGENVAEGQDGELVYTSIDARGSVVLRYRTGDYIKGGITYSPCPESGFTVPRVNSTITRVSNQKNLQLTKVKGTLVSLDVLGSALMGLKEVEEWAIEIRKENEDQFGLDELVVYIAPRGSINENDLQKLITHTFQEITEIVPSKVILESLPQLCARIGLETEMKEKRFFDKRS